MNSRNKERINTWTAEPTHQQAVNQSAAYLCVAMYVCSPSDTKQDYWNTRNKGGLAWPSHTHLTAVLSGIIIDRFHTQICYQTLGIKVVVDAMKQLYWPRILDVVPYCVSGANRTAQYSGINNTRTKRFLWNNFPVFFLVQFLNG